VGVSGGEGVGVSLGAAVSVGAEVGVKVDVLVAVAVGSGVSVGGKGVAVGWMVAVAGGLVGLGSSVIAGDAAVQLLKSRARSNNQESQALFSLRIRIFFSSSLPGGRKARPSLSSCCNRQAIFTRSA
jgi:hypothetical protein